MSVVVGWLVGLVWFGWVGQGQINTWREAEKVDQLRTPKT